MAFPKNSCCSVSPSMAVRALIRQGIPAASRSRSAVSGKMAAGRHDRSLPPVSVLAIPAAWNRKQFAKPFTPCSAISLGASGRLLSTERRNGERDDRPLATFVAETESGFSDLCCPVVRFSVPFHVLPANDRPARSGGAGPLQHCSGCRYSFAVGPGIASWNRRDSDILTAAVRFDLG